jgi:4-hydroxy 2-oxovalerate aldolase
MNDDIKILDCTLRDGGYINDWKWGESRAKKIIKKISNAHIDIVEVGFLRNVDNYDRNITVSTKISDLNKLIPKDSKCIYAAMAMRSNYDISQLEEYTGKGIELIRITAHDYDIDDIDEYAKEIQRKGYKVSINPINIMGYKDEELLNIVKKVNEVKPYQFSIVDTFGSMSRERLSQLIGLINHNMNKSIRMGLHLHENMALSYGLAQDLLAMKLNRPITIDGSLMGMGRTPGNLPIELICDYINKYFEGSYDLDYVLDAIYDYIYPFRGEISWGYTPEYFLSAKYNIHRNYAEFLLKKGNLTTKDVNHILSRIEKDKATVFDKEYIEQKYAEYITIIVDDKNDLFKLKQQLGRKEVLVVAPGNSLNKYKNSILEYINTKNTFVISLNFEPDNIPCDLAFYTNNKRYENATKRIAQIITSNIEKNDSMDYYLDFNSLSGGFSQGCNSLIMAFKLLKKLSVKKVSVVGADGYTNGDNYYDSSFRSYIDYDENFNSEVSKAIQLVGINPQFLTPTEYATSVWK